MNIDKDEVSIVATIIGFLAVIFTGGRAYEKIEGKVTVVSSRVDVLENKPPFVLVATCEERRAGCGRENRLQFEAGERQFAELKKLIADNDRAGNERHGEIMRILMEMNKA